MLPSTQMLEAGASLHEPIIIPVHLNSRHGQSNW
jgi:hypothetical protein